MDIKSTILNELELTKQKTIKEFDDDINVIKNEDNLIKIYSVLVDTLDNSSQKRELQLETLKNCLTNPFFDGAIIYKGANYITFSNDEFDIEFAIFKSKEINIKFKTKLSYQTNYSRCNEFNTKLANLIEIYLNKKSFKNFKILANYNCRRYQNNIIYKIYKYIYTYNTCNKEMLDSIRQRQEDIRIQQIKIDKSNKLYDDEQLHAKKFIDDLTDLKLFKDVGWRVRMYGVKDEYGMGLLL